MKIAREEHMEEVDRYFSKAGKHSHIQSPRLSQPVFITQNAK